RAKWRAGRFQFTTSRRHKARRGPSGSDMMKSGKEHTESLRDGREVYIDGAKVDDVTVHPAFRNLVASTAGLFDFANDPANRELMTFETAPGMRANRIWQLPKSYEELCG